ncbi:MAG: C25 family cysteine peptidase [Candidatus Eisenbacteria bacterium]
MRVAKRGNVAKSNSSGQGMAGSARRIGFAVCAILAILATHGFAGTYTHLVTVSPDDLQFSSRGGYDLVSIGGARWLNHPGEPRLPLLPVRLALPAGCEVVGLTVAYSDSTVLPGDFLIWPAQPPQSLSWNDPIEFVGPAEEIYAETTAYPRRAAELAGWGRLGGATICELVVFPLRYVPFEHKLILHKEVSLEIEYRWQASMPGSGADISDLGIIESIVSNARELRDMRPQQMHDASPIPLGGDPVTYLIITADSLRGYFEPLRIWKTRKGLAARTVSVETITYSYPGRDLAEKIRNCIKDFHSESGTDWVLLGGDTQIIPDRKAYVPLSDKPYLPCDLYYSDLDGTWNDDGDLYWGEVYADNIDMYADVYLGRAPVSSGPEVTTFVDKVLAYEAYSEVPQGHELDMLFIGEILWGDPKNPLDPDYTDAGVAKDLIDAAYVPARFTIEKLYESNGNLNYGTTMAALNQGKNIINILCHGQYTSVSIGEDRVDDTDFESLVNGPSYGLMYSASCLSGGFDQNDCLGETWVLTRDGGGFFIGNSRYGFNSPAFPGEGPSDYYDQSFFESIFVTGFTNLGKAHADAKHEFVAESRSDEYMRYIMYGLNLFGDPEMRLWTDTPAALEVTFAPEIGLDPQTYSVSVSSGGSPVENATVCLYKLDDVYCVDETDGAGEVDVFIDPIAYGTLFVTVTKADFVPFTAEASVTDGSPPARPENVIAEEETGPSVELTWSGVSDQDLHYYKVYRNTVMLPESLAAVPPEDTIYIDMDVSEGTVYYYWVTSIDSTGSESSLAEPCSVLVRGVTSVPPMWDEPDRGIIVNPNPFTHSVNFALHAEAQSVVRIDIYDTTGRWVTDIPAVKTGGGTWHGSWDGRDESGRKLSPGIYAVRFSTAGETSTHKVILLN